jgi:hypothetical protein
MRAGLILVAAAAGASGALAQPSPTPPAAAPVPPKVDAPGKLPEPPLSPPDLAYDARLKFSAAEAERFQGPLDGAWTVAAAGQGALYALQLTDKRDHVEGAWRDLRRPGDPAASGLIDEVQRSPAGVTLRFTPAGAAPVTVALGRNLAGELDQGGRRLAVVMRRTDPLPAVRSAGPPR